MKITRDLPQFNNERALIIVASEKDGQFYFVSDGNIDEIMEYKLPRLEYAESKKIFRPLVGSRGSGVIRTGSLRETAKEKNEEIFLREFGITVKKIIADYGVNSFYVFSSMYTIGDVFKKMPLRLRKEIKMIKQGNYHKKHQFELLKIIQKKMPGKIVLTSEKAEKILKKSRG